jgi:hypothetical protein
MLYKSSHRERESSIIADATGSMTLLRTCDGPENQPKI